MEFQLLQITCNTSVYTALIIVGGNQIVIMIYIYIYILYILSACTVHELFIYINLS